MRRGREGLLLTGGLPERRLQHGGVLDEAGRALPHCARQAQQGVGVGALRCTPHTDEHTLACWSSAAAAVARSHNS